MRPQPENIYMKSNQLCQKQIINQADSLESIIQESRNIQTKRLYIYKRFQRRDMMILRNTNLPHIEQIHFKHKQINERRQNFIFRHFSAHFLQLGFPAVSKVTLQHIQVQDETLREIISNLPNLTHIDLEYCNITALTIKQLFDNNLSKIQFMNLSDNNIGSLGSKMLSLLSFKNLNKLYLKSCNIGNAGIQSLAKGHWQQIQKIDLSDNQIGSDAWQLFYLMYLRKRTQVTIYYPFNKRNRSSLVFPIYRFNKSNLKIRLRNQEILKDYLNLMRTELYIYQNNRNA